MWTLYEVCKTSSLSLQWQHLDSCPVLSHMLTTSVAHAFPAAICESKLWGGLLKIPATAAKNPSKM